MKHCSHFGRYLRSGKSFEWCERCGALREGKAPAFGAWRIPMVSAGIGGFSWLDPEAFDVSKPYQVVALRVFGEMRSVKGILNRKHLVFSGRSGEDIFVPPFFWVPQMVLSVSDEAGAIVTDFELLAKPETPSDTVNFLSQIPPGSEMEALYMGNSFIEGIVRGSSVLAPRSR